MNIGAGDAGLGVMIATIAVIAIVVIVAVVLAVRRRLRRADGAGPWWQGPNAPEDPERDLHTRHQWE